MESYHFEYLLLILLSFVYLLTDQCANGLEVLYDAKFDESTIDCDSLFSTNWSTNGIPYSSSNICSSTCTRSDTSTSVNILTLNGAIYANGFQLKQLITQPYSIIGADIVYTLDNSQVTMSILDGSTTVQSITINSVREVGKFGINYQVSCPSFNSNRNTYIASLLYKSKLTANEAILKFQQTQLSSNPNENLMGIVQVRLWTNCVLNCDICADDQNCLKCFPGFKKKSLPSGQRVCEQTYSACQANCQTCNNSIDNSVSVCNNCIYGYYIASNNVCKQLQACPINQKYDYTISTCFNYTNKCFAQTSYKTNTWTSCDGLVDPGNYRCSVGEHILFYDWQNYKLVKCGCTDSKCEKCLDSQDKCYECYPGYSISGSQTKCTYNGSCPSNYFYDSNTSTCEPICSPNCDFCTDTKCIYCKRDKNYYVMASNQKNCAECNLPSCKTCNGSGLCTECTGSGLYLASDRSKCESCQVSHCSSCNIFSNSCLSCVKNYTNKISSCVCKFSESCQTCDNTDGNICLNCHPGFSYDSVNKKCNCTLQGCSTCKDQDGTKCKPTSCISGYSFDPITETCICGVQNCYQCNKTNGLNCNQCIAGYKTIGVSTCQCDSANCSVCSPNDGKKCQTCKPGYSLDISSSICFSNIPYCSTNNQTDVTKCDVCQPYYKTNNLKDQCIPILDNCVTIDSNNKCTQCISGYIYDSIQNKCYCGVQNCSICNQIDGSICDSCNTYYVQQDITNKKCIPQLYQCSQIDGNNKCLSCDNNYLLDTYNNKCICQVKFCSQCYNNNGQQCQTCQNLYYNQDNDTKCLPNINQCLEVESSNKCTKCEQNYRLDDISNTCQCNVKYCAQCDPKDGGVCQSCLSFYTKDPNGISCTSTISNCDIIDSSGKCIQCITGYKLDNDKNQCLCVVGNCSICNQEDGRICDQCVSNYLKLFSNTKCIKPIDNCLEYYPDNTCKSCQSDYIYNSTNNLCQCDVDYCDQCNSNSGSICDNCLPYYNLDQTNQKTCIPSIKSCKIINSSGQCEKCYSGFQYNVVNNTCECGVENCLQCSQDLGSVCQNCKAGYLSNSTNTLCQSSTENCIQFDQTTNRCIQCQQGFEIDLQSHICVCSAKNCILCDQNNGSQCSTCQNNYLKINNQCICQAQNCKSCEIGDGFLCKECIDGYILSPEDQKCYKNCSQGEVFNPKQAQCEKCQVTNCQQCKEFDSTTCYQCSQGYNLDTPQKCTQLKSCEVLKCKQCTKKDSAKCSECESGFVLNESLMCEKIIENNFKVVQSLTDEGYKIVILFDDKIVVSDDKLDKVIDMAIDNFDKYKVISLQNMNNLKIEANLQVLDNCKQNRLSVTIKDEQFVKVNNLKKKKDEITLNDYVKISVQEKQQAQAIKDTANSIQSSLLTSMLPIAILGNFYVLFNTIDYTTFLYFLLFVNVRHPQNILNFCSIFQNFQMAFIPNLFNLYFIDTGYVQNYTPKKYTEQQVDAYFFNQGGQSLVIVIAIMFIYLGLKVLAQFNLPFKSYLQSKIESGWEFCGFLDLYGFVQVYVFLGVLLQFYRFEFTESFSFLNYSIFSICLIASFLVPICIAIFLYKDQDLTQPQIQLQFASILGGLRIAKSEVIRNYNGHSKRTYLQLHYIKYNSIILTIRKILYCISIVFMHDYPYLQLTFISTLNSIIAFYYLYLWPHEAGYENCRNALSEFLLISMQIVIGLLVEDNQNQPESERFLYGWIFVGLSAFLIFIHVITVFLDFIRLNFRILTFVYFLIKVWYLTLKNHCKGIKNTVYPEKDQEQDNKKYSPNSQILHSHLKDQGINLDQTIDMSKIKNVIIRNMKKKYSDIKNHKIRHILTQNLKLVPQGTQLTKFPTRKESNNNSFDHQKEDSSSNFYNSGLFSVSARSNTVTKPKIVAFQPNTTNKEENQMLKSNFYQIYSPSIVNMSSFDFNPSAKNSLIDQQLSIRGGSTVIQKSEKLNSPNSSFKEDNNESINL